MGHIVLLNFNKLMPIVKSKLDKNKFWNRFRIIKSFIKETSIKIDKIFFKNY
jgi:hypothetical protein